VHAVAGGQHVARPNQGARAVVTDNADCKGHVTTRMSKYANANRLLKVLL
jgi:hypothetical protein